eukprot:TRINITY_DN113526_c0_g1_i1.p1 TRINITY_DN113526_c0_g1~~TRINITY_DN113526_c0_g1_i1.p1  ORF type:complete len:222 (+),score=34.46 TRINITY_DN113526_c0_g1_i1:49-666(+)
MVGTLAPAKLRVPAQHIIVLVGAITSVSGAELAATAGDEESLDCFTSESHFHFCCCEREQEECWSGAGRGPAERSRKRCCLHLMVHCGDMDRLTVEPLVVDGQRCGEGTASCNSSQLRAEPKSLTEVKVAERAKQAAVAASEAATAIVNGLVARSERCAEMHVYSPKHCCDRRFEPPNSRCFESLDVFEACCQGADATSEAWGAR